LNARHPGWFARVWNDFLTCGRMEDSNSPLIRRVKFTNLFGAITVLALYFFCAINFIDGRLFAGWIELALASVGVTLLHLMRRTRRFGLFQNAMLLLQMTLMTFLLYEGGSEQTGLFWWYTIPAGAFFLKGPRVGWLWTGGAIAEFFLMLGLDGAGLIELPYSHNFMLRFMASFTIVSILTWVYENIRHGYEALIERRNREWQDANHQLMLEIQERLRAEEAMQGARQEAERANRAKSEFLSRMSHELRTPMNSILGFAQLMEYDAAEPLTDSQRENVQHILRGGRHLLGLINEVLDLARIEAGRLEVSMAPVDARALVETCIRTLRPLAEQAEVTLHAPASAGVLLVMADLTRLRQCVLNLLGNAIKFNRRGGAVFVETAVAGDWLRLAVRDTGLGFDAGQALELFQPFHRLHREEQAEGTGIGLALTKQLVELMGGRIEAEGEPNRGATFTIYLKRAND
jgi:signal transduction histidine kinase